MSIFGIIIGLIIIGLMMLVHEAGHFYAGRLLKFKIIEFSIFMGPRIFTTEKDGIKYSFRLLPLGASVQFAGEHLEEETDQVIDPDDPGLFFKRPRWARAIVVFCGPLANFLTAFLAFIIMFLSFGVAVPKLDQPPENTLAFEAGIEAGDQLVRINGHKIRTAADYSIEQAFMNPKSDINIEVLDQHNQSKTYTLKPKTIERYRLGISQTMAENSQVTVAEVDPLSNEGNPVLEVGDILLSINGIDYLNTEEINKILTPDKQQDLEIKVNRQGKEITVNMKTTMFEDVLPTGIYFTESKEFSDVLYQSIHYPWSIVKSTIRGFGMMFNGQAKFSESVTGPVGIVKMFGDVVSDSPNISLMIYQLLFYFAMISVAIGFTNLFPIPPLDGHHLLILAIEGIRRKDLPEKFKHIVTAVGMILILTLAVLVIYFDIRKIF